MAAKSPRDSLRYHRLPEDWRKGEKLDFLREEDLRSVDWRGITPNAKNTWMRTETEYEFESFLPIGSKEGKRARPSKIDTIFRSYCSGAVTRRDMYAYDFDERKLLVRMKQFVADYNTQAFL